MKKTVSYVVFAFMLSIIYLFSSSNVKATSDLYKEIGSYKIINESKDEKYSFNKINEKYNYTFEYDFIIKTDKYFSDNGSKIFDFYGVSLGTSINYVNLDSGNWADPTNEVTHIKKYNYIRKEFSMDMINPKPNVESNFVIEYTGIYKVFTSDVDGSERITYIICDNSLSELVFDSVVFNYEGERSLEFSMSAKSPYKLNGCQDPTVVIDKKEYSISSCEVKEVKDEQNTTVIGEYDIVLKVSLLEPHFKQVSDGDVKINVVNTLLEINDVINYDVAAPVINSLKYYNYNIDNDEFSIEYNEGIVLPNDKILSRLEVNEDSVIEEFNLVFNKSGFSPTCDKTIFVESPLIIKNKIECSYLDENSLVQGAIVYFVSVKLLETDKYLIEVILDSEDYDIVNTINYEIIDQYQNKTNIVHDVVSFDKEQLVEDLGSYISYDSTKVEADFTTVGDNDFDKLCIFYGLDFDSEYECSEINDGKITKIEPSYSYKGSVVIVLLDSNKNIDYVTINSINFTKGYVEADYTFDVDGDYTNSVSIEEKLNSLIDIACGEKEICLQEARDSVYVKYGDLVEKLTETNLPTFVEILNNKYQEYTCATSACNKTIEVFIKYTLGKEEQTLKMLYNYVDKAPYVFITTSSSPDTNTFSFRDSATLELGNFDINSDVVRQMLYGNSLMVDLKSVDGKKYTGIVEPSFISYKDKDGNVTLLENKPYTYISTTKQLGEYLLECKVRLLFNVTDQISYEEEIYTKSSFMVVSLKDTTKPTLTLSGDETVKVFKDDVYKDAGVKCQDASKCVIKTSYYLNEENNEVTNIDTSIAGKYIIKYTAVDESGNVSDTVTRIVNVEEYNDLDSTSIIIIVSAVLVFILLVSIAIIIEVRKNKKFREFES